MDGRKVYLFDEKDNCMDYAYSNYEDDNGDIIHHLWSTSSINWAIPKRNSLLLTIREDGNGLCLPKMGGYADYSESYNFMLLTCIAMGYLPQGIRALVDYHIM